MGIVDYKPLADNYYHHQYFENSTDGAHYRRMSQSIESPLTNRTGNIVLAGVGVTASELPERLTSCIRNGNRRAVFVDFSLEVLKALRRLIENGKKEVSSDCVHYSEQDVSDGATTVFDEHIMQLLNSSSDSLEWIKSLKADEIFQIMMKDNGNGTRTLSLEIGHMMKDVSTVLMVDFIDGLLVETEYKVRRHITALLREKKITADEACEYLTHWQTFICDLHVRLAQMLLQSTVSEHPDATIVLSQAEDVQYRVPGREDALVLPRMPFEKLKEIASELGYTIESIAKWTTAHAASLLAGQKTDFDHHHAYSTVVMRRAQQ